MTPNRFLPWGVRKAAAPVVLRWHIDHEPSAIEKWCDRGEYIDISDFTLIGDEIATSSTPEWRVVRSCDRLYQR